MNIQLDGTVTPAFITSAGAFITAVLIFGASELARARSARKERRRQSVARLLDAIDRCIRAERAPRIAKVWQTSEVDLMLAQNRLLMDIPKGETDLWIWLRARVVEIADPKSGREKADIGGEMAGAVTGWYRGNIKAKWFAEQNVQEGNSL